MNVLDELRVGEKVSEGRFRIDQKRALEKLRKNRLLRPHEWVLDVLRAAQASGAKRVEARTDSDDVELSFDGKPFPAAVMKNLLAQALGGEDDAKQDPRYRLLALGVAGAMGMGHQRLHVHSGTVALDVDANGEVEVREVSARDRTVVKLKKKLSLSVATSWLTKKSPEGTLISITAWGYAPKLSLDGKPIGPFDPGEVVYEEGGLRVCVTPQSEQLDFSTVDFHVFGVRAGNRYWKLPGVQLVARVYCDTTQRNASGSDVVDTDPSLTKSLSLLRQVSLEKLREKVKEPSELLRAQLAKRLMTDEEPDAAAHAVIETMPLFPGPSGERHSIASLKAHVKKGAPLYVATSEYPKGSYPETTVLLCPETTRFEPLLPGSKREDVAPLVRRNQRAAENKLAWERAPQEEPTLPQRDWLATARIDTKKMRGEVGLEAKGSGAFVRLLSQGRFLQEGEVPLLAPLRLRAVVDLHGPLGDKAWAEIPNPKLWSTLLEEVEAAAERALGAALETPTDAVLDHVRDVLARRGSDGRAGLPKPVLTAPLFPLLGSGRVSLGELATASTVRWVDSMRPPPLDGSRVVVLDPLDVKLVQPYLTGRFVDVSEQLDDERAIRQRLSGPKEHPRVDGALFTVPLRGEGLTGVIGLSGDSSDKLELTLLRDGFRLEQTSQTPRYGPTLAAVECAALKPAPDWKHAVRDPAFEKVLSAVREGERALLPVLLSRFPTFNLMPVAARGWLIGFAKKERPPELLDAKLLDGPTGPMSLSALKKLAEPNARTVWLLPTWRTAELLAGTPTVSGDSDTEALIEAALELECSDGAAELERAARRARFRDSPQHDAKVKPGAPLFTQLTHDGIEVTAALDLSDEPRAACVLVLEQRRWLDEGVTAGLPLQVELRLEGLDPAGHLDEPLRRRVAAAVMAVQQAMLTRALANPEAPDSRRALFLALKARAEAALPEPLARRLLDAPLFECTDGVSRAAAALHKQKAVPYVTKRLEVPARGKDATVIAVDPLVQLGLSRFTRDDVTETLEVENLARAQRLRGRPVEKVTWSSPALLRLELHGRITGEVVLAPSADGRLELFHELRPLCVVPAALPLPLAAAVNCDALQPQPRHDGVVRDAEYQKVVDQIEACAEELATLLAQQWERLRHQGGARESALRLCALLATRKGKKRRHPLLEVPLLVTTDGQPKSVQNLLDEQATHLHVLTAQREGSLLDSRRFVWRPDWEVHRWLERLELETKDATDELERAERVRSRPRVEVLRAPHDGGFRDRFEARGISGELALPDAPTKKLVVELYREHALLERYETEHACGAVAAVNFDKLAPNATWTKAARNTQFRTVLAELDDAIERAVAKRLAQRDGGWRAWAENAVGWGAREAGPVAHQLNDLELFETLDGTPVKVGQVLAEYQRTRRIAVASAGLSARGKFVLKHSAHLDALGVTVKDVSPELLRQGELEADRRARRLEQLSWSGDALVRVKLKALGMNGELALPAGDPNVEVTLAKDGVRIQPLPSGLAPGVAGVADIDGLLVDEAWKEARLAPPEREVIEQAVNELYGQLCRVAPSLSAERRTQARRHVLAGLQQAGVTAAAHLTRLTGVAAQLATAPVFETTGGDWVGLAVLADEVQRRGRLAVFARSLFRPDTAGALGIVTKHLDDAWLDALEKLLGGGCLERVKDTGLWREMLREEDPPEGSPELWALRRLRRDMRLLRAGALGELSPEDVEDVRLRPLGGEHPVHYDARRKVVLLDSQHAQLMTALAEAKVRRERLYVLLAAIYGAINRALARVTDAHEEQLMTALAAHLAANLQLLDAE